MKEEKIYINHKLTTAGVMEIYAKTIANHGIFNFLHEKSISCHTDGQMAGQTIVGFYTGLHAYIAVQLMTLEGDVKSAYMERGPWFTGDYSRKISLEQLANNNTKVTFEGTKHGVSYMKKKVDEMYVSSPEDVWLAKVIENILKED